MTREFRRVMRTVCAAAIAAALTAAAGMGRPAFAVEAPPMTACISVTYTIKGDAQKAGPASFVLRAKDAMTPMPEGAEGGEKEIRMKEPGTMSFGEITYAAPDIYHYQVMRNNEPDHVTTVDGSAFDVEVIALGDGQTCQIIRKGGEQAKSELHFVDHINEVRAEGEQETAAPGVSTAGVPGPEEEKTVDETEPKETEEGNDVMAIIREMKAKTGDGRGPVIAGMAFGVACVLLLVLLARGRNRHDTWKR